MFEDLIIKTRPSLIIEIGSWKGGSAIHMANVCVRHGLDTEIVCVDTWLGGLDAWTIPEWFPLRNGMPFLYEQFVANVFHAGHQDRITPIPTTSHIAARLLALVQVKAELIYVDGSHLEKDVLDDLDGYYPLVARGGVLCGDDWTFPEVRRAVERFFGWRERFINVAEQQWWIQK